MLATTLPIRVVRNIDFWRGNYRNKDMPRYNLSIAIFDTIRYIMPSLRKKWSMTWLEFDTWYDMHQIRGVFWTYIACFSLAYSTVGPRVSVYADVWCRKARSHCVWCRILHARRWKYDSVRLHMPTCGNVRRRTSMQDAADAKIICYLT